MKFDLKGKTAIVTGGGSGIGKAISEILSEQGATVHILEMDPESALQTVKIIQQRGLKAEAHKCNVTSQEEVKKIIDKISANSKIDILINNAGIAHIGNVENTTEDDLDRIYNVNVKGVYNCIHCLIPHFKENGGGVIINMCSVAASVGLADRFAYSISKGAVKTMTMQVAKDYVTDNIRCNSISPARIHTPFVDGFIKNKYPDRQEEVFEELSKTQPIGRMGKPSEAAAFAVYLASNEAAFATGTDYPIDGGFLTLNTP